MRKLFLFVFGASLVLMCFSSCKTHEKCPAYTKSGTEKAVPAVKVS